MLYRKVESISARGKRKKANLAELTTDLIMSSDDAMIIENAMDYWGSVHQAHCSLYRACKEANLNYTMKKGRCYIFKKG